jgi:predicted alpha/beta-hydrolase family hydrolase
MTLCITNGGSASDYLYEKQLSDAIVQSLDEGEAVWLKSAQRSFLSILLEAETRQVQGAVLILPGISGHADSAGLVHALRTEFAAHGWHTMSLQTPVRAPNQDLKNYLGLIAGAGTRIQSAVAYLAARNIKNIVLIGHGFGAWMAVDYLNVGKKPAVAALVLVGMPVFRDNPPVVSQVETLKSSAVPVLDIFGSRDLNTVVNSAGLRRRWMKNNRSFRQLEIAGANHEFHSDTELLFKRIYSWATHNVPALRTEK